MIGTDVYKCWRMSLKGETVSDDMMLPTGVGGTDGHPQPGLYRKKQGGGYVDGKKQEHRWIPVKIWLEADDGTPVHKWNEGLKVKALVGKTETTDAVSIWGWCQTRAKDGHVMAYNAVSQADYKFWLENGRWPDEMPEALTAGIGHNSAADDEDIFAVLSREIDGEKQRVLSWLDEPHEGQNAANMAANWLDILRKLEGKITDAHKIEKAPHLEAGKLVDDKWRPLKVDAEEIKRRMAGALSEIGIKEKRRLQAIADAEAAKRAAELKAQREAERARMEALAAENRVHLEPVPQEPEPIVVAAPVKAAFGGARGSRIGLKEYKVALVSDWNAAVLHYVKSDKVREIVQKLATADAKNGVEVPGVKIVIEERV